MNDATKLRPAPLLDEPTLGLAPECRVRVAPCRPGYVLEHARIVWEAPVRNGGGAYHL